MSFNSKSGDFTNTLYTKEQVATHSTEESLWIIIDTVVYDLTDFVE